MARIVGCLVLYKMALEESPTYRSLRSAAGEVKGAAEAIRLFVADNSPQAGVRPLDFDGMYLHDGQNVGLAHRYNQALQLAQETGAKWLLLLDQDTTLHAAYIAELLELSEKLTSDERIAMVVPKLVMERRLMSPHVPRFQWSRYAVSMESVGLVGETLMAYNSGALLRVRALETIGGFSEDYWLDYLDHVTFQRLRQRGGQMYVMRSVLEHDLAESRVGAPINYPRLENRMQAEARYYEQYGTRMQYVLSRIDLIRQVIGHGRRGRMKEAKVGWRALREKK